MARESWGKTYMDEHTSCQDMRGFDLDSLKHGVGGHAKNQTHTYGVESL